METKTISSIDELSLYVKDFLANRTPNQYTATVVALSGDLGAGKTTFVQHIAKELGVTEPVTSPTFTLMKRYDITDERFQTLIHMDAYRIESAAELEPLRFAELLQQPKTMVCIEWADKIKTALPEDTSWLHLDIDADGHHTIQKQS